MIELRPWSYHDIDSLVKHANNPKIANRLTDAFPHPYTESAGKQFLDRATQSNPCTIWAIDLNGQAIGGIGVHPQGDIYRLNAELGYWLAEDYWGRGIMSEAIQMACKMAFERLEIKRIYARPFGSNLASQRVLKKTGFVLEARIQGAFIKNGEIEDELIYAIRR